MSDERFLKARRLRVQSEFQRVYDRGVYAADDVLVLLACENELGFARLGLAVSKRVGNAVVRNRWKRRFREAFRRCWLEQLNYSVDFVLRPKKGAVCDFHAIARSLPRLAKLAARRLTERPPPNSAEK
ncbi:MAG: ribonuclease P protein component [bacterium]|nr:ribonuclease P protein component [bacterium]